MPHRLAAIVLVLLVAVAACGDDDGSSTATADDGSTTTPTAPAGGDEPLPSSFAELVGPLPSLDPVAAQQWYLDREAERQEAIAACMADVDAEYVPVDPAEVADAPWSTDVEWASSEWVHTYGFGASTLRFPQSLVGPDLVGFPDEEDDVAPHPNQVHVEALSPEERERWESAYADCDTTTWASSQAQNLAAAFNERFAAELTAMHDALRADARYVSVQADVQACVAAAGVDHVDHESTLADIEARLAPLDEAAMTDGLSADDLAELATIQADEIAVATAVDECGGRFLSANAAYAELVGEYESAFITEHQDALRDFLGDA